MHNLPLLSRISKLHTGFHCHIILQTLQILSINVTIIIRLLQKQSKHQDRQTSVSINSYLGIWSNKGVQSAYCVIVIYCIFDTKL